MNKLYTVVVVGYLILASLGNAFAKDASEKSSVITIKNENIQTWIDTLFSKKLLQNFNKSNDTKPVFNNRMMESKTGQNLTTNSMRNANSNASYASGQSGG